MSAGARFAGKVAVVTGAADGMGQATALRFLAEGASVFACDLDADKLRAALGDDGPRLRLIAQDITAREAPERLIDGAAAAFGGLDILVNNAGVVAFEPVETTSDETWLRTLNVNLTAVFALSRRAIPHLRAQGGGRIVNLASIAAVRAGVGLAAYNASKHGVAGLTKTLAVELGKDGITANYIMPGFILTGMTRPLLDGRNSAMEIFENMGVVGRVGTPEDIASAVLFLASDEAGFITGHGLAVDGGFLAKH